MNLHEALNEGDNAKQVLENAAFIAAFAAIEADLVDKWKHSQAKDEADRQRIWQYLQMLYRLREQLTQTMDSGKLAQLELQHQQNLWDKAKNLLG